MAGSQSLRFQAGMCLGYTACMKRFRCCWKIFQTGTVHTHWQTVHLVLKTFQAGKAWAYWSPHYNSYP